MCYKMKNITVDSNIIQRFYVCFLGRTNPDSIKSLWLECEKIKPEDITSSWDNFDIRLLCWRERY